MLLWVINEVILEMINYQEDLDFSKLRSTKRLAIARKLLGERVVSRMIALALYLLGGERQAVADFLKIPLDTLKSFFKRANSEGIAALQDGRRKQPLEKEEKPKEKRELSDKATLAFEGDQMVVSFEGGRQDLRIRRANSVQCKTLLLTLWKNRVIPLKEAAGAMGISKDHFRKMSGKLDKEDVGGLMDQRKGQQQEYRVGAEQKAQLIQQFVIDLTTLGKTSSGQLANHLNERCQMELSSRTIRLHLNKLGLSLVKDSLLKFLQKAKKNLRTSG